MQQEATVDFFQSRPQNYTTPVNQQTKKYIAIILYNIAYLMVFQNQFNEQYRKLVFDYLQGSQKQMLKQIISSLQAQYDYIKRESQYLFEQSDEERLPKLIPVFTNILTKVQSEQIYQISLQGLDNILKFIFDDDLVEQWQLQFFQKQLYCFCKHNSIFLPQIASVFVKNLQYCNPDTGYHFPPNKNLNKDTQIVMEYLLFIASLNYNYDNCDFNSLLTYCSFYLAPTINQLHLISTYPWLYLRQRHILDGKKSKVLKLLSYFIQNNHRFYQYLILKICKNLWNQYGELQYNSNLNTLLGTPSKLLSIDVQLNKNTALYLKYLLLIKQLPAYHTYHNLVNSILNACKYNFLKYGDNILFKYLISYLAAKKPWQAIYLTLKINEIVITFELFQNLFPYQFKLHYFSQLETQIVIQKSENLHINLKTGLIILAMQFLKNVVNNFDHNIILKVIKLPFIAGIFSLTISILNNLIQLSCNQTSIQKLINQIDTILTIFNQIKEKVKENMLLCFGKSEYMLQAVQVVQKISQSKIFSNKILPINSELYKQFKCQLKCQQSQLRQLYRSCCQISKTTGIWQCDDTISID